MGFMEELPEITEVSEDTMIPCSVDGINVNKVSAANLGGLGGGDGLDYWKEDEQNISREIIYSGQDNYKVSFNEKDYTLAGPDDSVLDATVGKVYQAAYTKPSSFSSAEHIVQSSSSPNILGMLNLMFRPGDDHEEYFYKSQFEGDGAVLGSGSPNEPSAKSFYAGTFTVNTYGRPHDGRYLYDEPENTMIFCDEFGEKADAYYGTLTTGLNTDSPVTSALHYPSHDDFVTWLNNFQSEHPDWTLGVDYRVDEDEKVALPLTGVAIITCLGNKVPKPITSINGHYRYTPFKRRTGVQLDRAYGVNYYNDRYRRPMHIRTYAAIKDVIFDVLLLVYQTDHYDENNGEYLRDIDNLFPDGPPDTGYECDHWAYYDDTITEYESVGTDPYGYVWSLTAEFDSYVQDKAHLIAQDLVEIMVGREKEIQTMEMYPGDAPLGIGGYRTAISNRDVDDVAFETGVLNPTGTYFSPTAKIQRSGEASFKTVSAEQIYITPNPSEQPDLRISLMNLFELKGEGGGGGGGGGSTVEVTQVNKNLDSNKIATITVDGADTDIYAPKAELEVATNVNVATLTLWEKYGDRGGTRQQVGQFVVPSNAKYILPSLASHSAALKFVRVNSLRTGYELVDIHDVVPSLPSVSVSDEGKALVVDSNGDWVAGVPDVPDELPAVTSADNNKVLKVTSGAWAVGNAPTELPAVTSADNGSILKVINGEWMKGSETTELPNVSSSDNGKVLKVVNGMWLASTEAGGAPDTPTLPLSLSTIYSTSYIQPAGTSGNVYDNYAPHRLYSTPPLALDTKHTYYIDATLKLVSATNVNSGDTIRLAVWPIVDFHSTGKLYDPRDAGLDISSKFTPSIQNLDKTVEIVNGEANIHLSGHINTYCDSADATTYAFCFIAIINSTNSAPPALGNAYFDYYVKEE